MSKLSDKQRKKIIAEYVAGDGKVSIRALAKKYNVSPSTIAKLLGDEKSIQKCTDKKKDNEFSMLAFLDNRKDKAQKLIDQILDTLPKDFEKASMRDKAGLLKILSETFTPKDGTQEEHEPLSVTLRIEDVSGGEE